MQANTPVGRLVAALARKEEPSTPLDAHSAPGFQFFNKIISALARADNPAPDNVDNSPDFSTIAPEFDRGSPSEFIKRQSNIAVLDPEATLEADRIALLIFPAFGDLDAAKKFAQNGANGLALGLIRPKSRSRAMSLIQGVLRNLVSSLARDIDIAQSLRLEKTTLTGRRRTTFLTQIYLDKIASSGGAFPPDFRPTGLSVVQLLEAARKSAIDALKDGYPKRNVNDAALYLSLATSLTSTLRVRSIWDLNSRRRRLIRQLSSLMKDDLEAATVVANGLDLDLRDADLTNVNLLGLDLTGIIWSRSTEWPGEVGEEAYRRSKPVGRNAFIIDDYEGGDSPSKRLSEAGLFIAPR